MPGREASAQLCQSRHNRSAPTQLPQRRQRCATRDDAGVELFLAAQLKDSRLQGAASAGGLTVVTDDAPATATMSTNQQHTPQRSDVPPVRLRETFVSSACQPLRTKCLNLGLHCKLQRYACTCAWRWVGFAWQAAEWRCLCALSLSVHCLLPDTGNKSLCCIYGAILWLHLREVHGWCSNAGVCTGVCTRLLVLCLTAVCVDARICP